MPVSIAVKCAVAALDLRERIRIEMEDPTAAKSQHEASDRASHSRDEAKGGRSRSKDESVAAGTAALLVVFVCGLLLMQWRVWPSSRQQEFGHGSIPSPDRAQPTSESETESILARLSENGTRACHDEHTNHTLFSGLEFPLDETPLRLSTNTLHRLLLTSYNAEGRRRCAGGDFYETELQSQSWKSRPPVQDFGNGSYGVTLMVDSAFQGLFSFSATLLFDCFHGLELMEREWDVRIQSPRVKILFYDEARGEKSPSDRISRGMGSCRSEPGSFSRKEWRGRWTRGWINDSCSADGQGRFASCVPRDHDACTEPRCSGRVSRLESNSWVYSAHCGFRIFETQEAWDCVSGKWLLFWGDSNFQDTIRNLMLFVLGVPVPYWSTLPDFQLPRQFEEWFVNPGRPDQALHISMIFNGHYNVYDGDLGLDSLQNPDYREWIIRHFTGEGATPDTVIMNSGLHDGNHFRTVGDFVGAVDRAISFWQMVLDIPQTKRSNLIYRTTVAPAGESRGMQSNPHKMEIFNKVLVERLQAAMPSTQIVDAFDMTFPFHFDNNYSDGGHYGRAPNVNKWPWFGQPHHYFVDLMLAHVLLNAICPV
ncbi:hypothetical protein MPTK1_1g28570 [Marchantia polymorpha subsp. ruderalis]